MFNTYKLKTVFKELLVVKKDKTIFWFFPSFFAFLYIFLKNWFCMFSLTAAPCMALLRHLISLLKSYFLMFFWIPKFWQDLYIAKLHVIFFLFFMVFLKAVMAQLIRLDLFLQTYFSIFCVENCFVIFFFCNCAMHGAVETFNSIFKELIFGIFLNTNVLAEFVVYLILFEEYCEFGEGGRRKNEIWWNLLFFLTGRSLFLIKELVKFGEKTEVYFF